MTIAPRVTVLMTVYNGLPYLAQAVESVLAQTLAVFELLIIDDASTDESIRCLERYRDPRIRLFRNECNLGHVRSLNRGLSLCTSLYVARLDQDDSCYATRLERQVRFLDEHPQVAVVGSRMEGMDPSGRRGTGLLGHRLENYGTFAASLLVGRCPLCHPSVMFRREVVGGLGGYDEDFAPAEDVELWMRMALARHEAAVIPEPLVRHRLHPAQQSVTKAARQQEQIWRSHTRILQTFGPPAHVAGLQHLLQRDSGVWNDYDSQARALELMQAFRALTETLQERLRMSELERAAFTRVLDRWFGPGLRLAPAWGRWPSWAFYAGLWGLSPLLAPRVRPLAARMAHPVRRAREAIALVWADAKRRGA